MLVQWIVVAIWYAWSPFPESGADRAAFAVALAIAGPAISAPAFVAANGLVVLYPDWAGKPASGSCSERLGAPRNVVRLATFVAAAVALAPAALAGVFAGWIAWTVVGP